MSMSVLRLWAALQLGGAEWLRVEPLGRPVESRDAQTTEYGHLAELPEAGADLF
jgi:hypothetical protein